MSDNIELKIQNNRVHRESNIELLRIISILGVIVLHYNNSEIGGAFAYVKNGSLNFYILYFLESLFACAVDLFILISGYFMCCSKKCNLWKPIKLLVQVVVFSVGIYLMKIFLGHEAFTLKGLIRELFPNNYFVILYISIYILSPYINLILGELNQNQLKRFVITCYLLFSLWPTFVDLSGEIFGIEWIGLSSIGMYGSQWGYTIINFMLMYIIGAYIRSEGYKEINKRNLLFFLLLNTFILMIWARINDIIGYFNERSAWEYCNPLVILEAILCFLIFKKIDIKNKKWINKLAEAGFTVYLLHNIFVRMLNVEKYVTCNAIIMIIHIFISSIIIYIMCWIVYKVYDFIMSFVFKFLEKKIVLPQINIVSNINSKEET